MTWSTVARRGQIWMVITASAATVLSLPAAADSAGRTFAADVDGIVQRGLDEQRYPGAVVLIGRGGRTLYSKAYGRHTYALDGLPMRLDTVFDLASVTKVAGTTPAAMCLVDDGKLDLDSPVSRYLPGFEANGKASVTMRDVMTHVSGLKAYESFSVVEKARSPEESHAKALMRHYAGLPLAYAPRSKVVYSCLNFQTTAGIVQSIAGSPLESLLAERLWKPLGMRDTTYRPTGRRLERCAPTGVRADGTPIRGEVHDPLALYHGSEPTCPGNAGLYSTARDLERYLRMILNGGRARGKRVLSPESVALMTSVQTPPGVTVLRSVGWGIYDSVGFAGGPRPAGEEVVGHTGYTGTFVWMDKRTKAYVILLTNRVYPSPATKGGEGTAIDDIRRRLCQRVMELPR